MNGEVTIFASVCRSSLSDTNKLEHMLLRRFGLDPAMWGLQVFLAADAGNSTECLTSNSQLEESMIPRLDARLPFQLWCKQIPKGSSRTPTNPTARVAVTPAQAAAAVQAARNLLTPGAVPMPAAAAPAAAPAAAAAATQQASLEKSTGNGKERKVNALAKRQKQVKTWLVYIKNDVLLTSPGGVAHVGLFNHQQFGTGAEGDSSEITEWAEYKGSGVVGKCKFPGCDHKGWNAFSQWEQVARGVEPSKPTRLKNWHPAKMKKHFKPNHKPINSSVGTSAFWWRWRSGGGGRGYRMWLWWWRWWRRRRRRRQRRRRWRWWR